MSKTQLVLFWIIWLLDVLMGLLGHRQFITLIFGRYASPGFKLAAIWIAILLVMLLILYASLYFKNHERGTLALTIAAVPVALALPYVLWLGVILIAGRNTNWH